MVPVSHFANDRAFLSDPLWLSGAEKVENLLVAGRCISAGVVAHLLCVT